jgi:hypothetical protein
MTGKRSEDKGFAYTVVPSTLRTFMKGIPTNAVPPRVSEKYLKSIGMKASNDTSIIRVLKFVGLLDSSGVPTAEYKSFRDKTRGPAILADLTRKAYAELYSTYEDAQYRSDEELKNFFRPHTTLGDQVVTYQVGTFKALTEFADFKATPAARSASIGPATPETYLEPSIHLNLQIHLPDSKDPATYDMIFQAIAKHLLRKA